MPNIKSQIKRVKTSEKRRQANKAVRSDLRTRVASFRAAVVEKDLDAAEDKFRAAAKALDKAAAKGVIHRNNAANKKSGMRRQLNESSHS